MSGREPLTLTHSNGWSSAARVVRELDEQKVQDCKEDIDTLLVFAGLFSAVTTAFLIESYKNLQQDPTTLTALVLAHISAQAGSFTVQGSNINSTIAPFTIPPYEAPTSAVQVNVLWFASLVFSLVTASVAMLVKQWLRAYLASEHSSPQQRLRIRHFRNSGLRAWKVFEIAATLPILLQLALGLFFLGLCIFAKSVHPSVGNTCVPLVTGWIAFFLAATLAPVLSPKCPYNTPLFKGPMRALRLGGHKIASFLSMWMQRILETRTRVAREIRTPWSNYDGPMTKTGFPSEEEEVVKETYWDTEILLAVDAALLDEDLLCNALWDAMKQMPLSTEGVVDFAWEIIKHRLEDYELDMGLPYNLQYIAPQTWNTVLVTLAEVFATGLKTVPTDHTNWALDWELWINDALLLLLSHSPHWNTISPTVIECLRFCFARNRSETCCALASAPCIRNPDPPAHGIFADYVEKLGTVFPQMTDNQTAFAYLQEIIGRSILKADYDADSFSFDKLPDFPYEARLPRMNMYVVAEVMTNILNDELTKTSSINCNTNPAWAPWMSDILQAILYSIASSEASVDQEFNIRATNTKLGRAFRRFLTTETSADAFFRCFAKDGQYLLRGYTMQCCIHGLYVEENAVPKALANLGSAIGQLSRDGASLSLCYLAIRMIRLPKASRWLNQWRAIFDKTAAVIRDIRGSLLTAQDRKLCETCLRLIHGMECDQFLETSRTFRVPIPGDTECLDPDDDATYHTWRTSFDPGRSMFPDELIQVLRSRATNEGNWYRVRLLRDNDTRNRTK